MGHAVEFLRPSAAATWTTCTGSVAMRAQFPEIPDESDDEVREDGTACHWLASESWEQRVPALNSLSPNNRVLDEEMFDAADLYLDVLRSWPNVVPVVEKEIPCDIIYRGMKGTPDAWAYDPDNRILYVADLKYGFKFVEVWYNWQLMVYALALLELLGLNNGLIDQNITIVFTICQPRSYHRNGPVRTWRVKASELRPYRNILIAKAQEAMEKDEPVCTPNPGCTDCAARHACTALQNAALTALEVSYKGLPLELEPAAIGDELRRLADAKKKLEARITGLEMQSESLLRNGKVVPGWTLAATFARERWRDGAEEKILAIAQYYGQDVSQPRKPVTPAKARKLLPADVVATFSHKPSTGVRLTKADPYEAQKVFQQP